MMLSKEKDINKARQIATANKESTGGFVSGVISYVGKANFGESEKYITDFRTTTDNPSALLVEIAAVNGKFYLDFIQNFKDERYFNAFKKELEDLKTKYGNAENEYKNEVRNTKIKIGGEMYKRYMQGFTKGKKEEDLENQQHTQYLFKKLKF